MEEQANSIRNQEPNQIPKEKLLNTIATANNKKINTKDFDVIDLNFGDRSVLFDQLHFDKMPSQDLLLDRMTNYIKTIDCYCQDKTLKLDKNKCINILVDVKPYMVKTLYRVINFYAAEEINFYAAEEKDNKDMSTKLVHKFIIHFPFYNKDGIIANAFSDITYK